MVASLAGVLVSAGLLALGFALRAPLIGALFASLPFGSTAIVTLGGSSPLVFSVFAVLLLASIALRKGFLDDLAAVLANVRAVPIVCILTAYAVASAFLLPRLFAGATTAQVVVEGALIEVPLGPVPGNVTQTAYLALGALIFLGFCILLQRQNRWHAIERGFFTFATVHAALGAIDLGAKVAGAGDVLEPIRTASYAFLVDIMEQGFWRIVGAYPEASTFAGHTLPCLAFAFVYWRGTGSRYALALSLVLLLLLLLSTSATGYTGLIILLLLLLGSIGLGGLRGRLRATDLALFAMVWVALAIALCVYLYAERVFDPFLSMLDAMVFDKAASVSGQERAYWNERGLEAFFATYGLGIGMGSSRTSSWLVSVLSQTGRHRGRAVRHARGGVPARHRAGRGCGPGSRDRCAR